MSSLIPIGADPELLLQNKTGDFIASCGLFGGTKDNPLPLTKDIAIQEDNVAIEYNIKPTFRAAGWLSQHTEAIDLIQKLANNHGLSISPATSASFKTENLGDSRAWIFGCDPDYNVWSCQTNPRPFSEDENLRCVGGHIHIGIGTGYSNKRKIILGRLCDLLIGVPLATYDKDLKRKSLYGKAGAIRFKPYGIEYRTPSSIWLHTEELTDFVYHMALSAASNILSSTHFIPIHQFLLQHETAIIRVINHGDPTLQKELITKTINKIKINMTKSVENVLNAAYS